MDMPVSFNWFRVNRLKVWGLREEGSKFHWVGQQGYM